MTDKEIQAKWTPPYASRLMHPTDVAYAAGQALAKKHKNLSEERVRAAAEKYDDEDAFIDGFYDRLDDI
jgi:hypothetical protein